MVNYKRVESDNELQQILNIQKKAPKKNVSLEEQKEQGYVTVLHTFEILKKINDACPHIIAMEDKKVVGYALTMLHNFRYGMPILTPMFDIADGLYPNKNYLVMGQICIDKPYRGKGIFKRLYSYYRDELSSQFKCLITEVATLNTRSLNAYKAVRFKILENHVSENVSWEIISWEW